ncbi:MAG: NPCBM/NEW2 domain-containing protein [Chthonomonadales bacterium]|nr:NPCBM/NEW2 domain-containing protein [Chthonomonadales bacterium]
MRPLGIDLAIPNDSVMAPPALVRATREWAAAAFGAPPPRRVVPLRVLRQDHSVLRFGRSCIDTPLRIGGQAFQHGLGTHAVSEIEVGIPPRTRAFRASVGVDNNEESTGGARGSVRFTVLCEGTEIAASGVVRGGQEPERIDVAIPPGADRLLLRVEDGGDGPAFDQADWADARLVLADGAERRLDEGQLDLLPDATGAPFSFVYGGRLSRELLAGWERTESTRRQPGRSVRTVRWTDSATGLVVTADVTTYARYPAVDWVISFENLGPADTPILEQVQALDVRLRSGYARRDLTLYQLAGDSCAEGSFLPVAAPVTAGKCVRLAPTGGRPSSTTAFPWFDVRYGDQGMTAAIGWTGQWAAVLDRAATGPARLAAGMELTHLRLHPGERIRTPRILLMPWEGDRTTAHNRWRRLLLEHYVPRLDGKPARLPIALQTFDRYWQRPGWATEEGQKEYVRTAHALGCDAVWLDAAWFPGGFPNGVGSWHCDPARFPNGLRPVADLCHRLGMRFVLWFEPERVAAGSQIARERPEWVFGGASGGLFRLDLAEAREWMAGLLGKRIDEYGVDVYRNDFNIDPLGFWRSNDPPDRQGITEIRYVEGLYAMWDALRAARPGLLIDNCAGGGRRLDLEMCMRSVPLWRSDTGCSPGHPEWNQMQSAAVGQCIPLHTIGVWSDAPYEARSGATAGAACEWGYLEPGFSVARAGVAIKEMEACRPYWYGDLYPLTPVDTRSDGFAAYQYHRADLDGGIVLAFRRPQCATVGLIVALRGVRPASTYEVTYLPEGGKPRTERLSGRELASGLTLRVAGPGRSLLVRYRAVTAR